MLKHFYWIQAVVVVSLLLGAGMSTTHGAQTRAGNDSPGNGDITKSQQLVASCLGCHGSSGYHNAYPSFRIPLLGGQSEAYLLQTLQDYRDERRKNPTMRAQMQNYSEQQLVDIARYLSHTR